MNRAKNSGITLTQKDAAVVKGMLRRGDRQHDIASWFGVNGGRIAEISTRAKFSDVLPITKMLPPPGPYLSGRQSKLAKDRMTSAIEILESLDVRTSDAKVNFENILTELKEIRDLL